MRDIEIYRIKMAKEKTPNREIKAMSKKKGRYKCADSFGPNTEIYFQCCLYLANACQVVFFFFHHTRTVQFSMMWNGHDEPPLTISASPTSMWYSVRLRPCRCGFCYSLFFSSLFHNQRNGSRCPFQWRSGSAQPHTAFVCLQSCGV